MGKEEEEEAEEGTGERRVVMVAVSRKATLLLSKMAVLKQFMVLRMFLLTNPSLILLKWLWWRWTLIPLQVSPPLSTIALFRQLLKPLPLPLSPPQTWMTRARKSPALRHPSLLTEHPQNIASMPGNR
jgi:hypothetical protein